MRKAWLRRCLGRKPVAAVRRAKWVWADEGPSLMARLPDVYREFYDRGEAIEWAKADAHREGVAPHHGPRAWNEDDCIPCLPDGDSLPVVRYTVSALPPSIEEAP